MLRDGGGRAVSTLDTRRHELTWNRYAASYDRILLEMPYYLEVLERHRAAMTAPGVHEVLDVGAGTGNVTLPLLAAGRRVTAVDRSRAMLDRLRAKSRGEHAALTVLERDAQDLGDFGAESFDGVTLLLTLYDMDEPRRALEHAIRLLRDGGVLVVTEPKRSFELEVILAEVERVLRSKGLWRELQPDWRRVRDANRELDPSQVRSAPRAGRLFIEEIGKTLADRGFAVSAPCDSHLGNCATVVARKGSGASRTASPGHGAATPLVAGGVG
jgi:ubiquinone/menaquinone biosynthesis C-methylase UbiE